MTNYFNSRPFLLLSRAMEFYNAYGRVKGEWLGKVVLVAVVVVVVVAVAVAVAVAVVAYTHTSTQTQTQTHTTHCNPQLCGTKQRARAPRSILRLRVDERRGTGKEARHGRWRDRTRRGGEETGRVVVCHFCCYPLASPQCQLTTPRTPHNARNARNALRCAHETQCTHPRNTTRCDATQHNTKTVARCCAGRCPPSALWRSRSAKRCLNGPTSFRRMHARR